MELKELMEGYENMLKETAALEKLPEELAPKQWQRFFKLMEGYEMILLIEFKDELDNDLREYLVDKYDIL